MENIFVTVGTTKFDKLIQTILHPESIKALKCRGCKRIKLQIGKGNTVPDQTEIDGVQITYYQYKNSISDDIAEADLVISHAGAGSCLETLELQKALLVVVNEDLMDNHQFEVALKLSELKYLHYTTCANFINSIKKNKFQFFTTLSETESDFICQSDRLYDGFRTINILNTKKILPFKFL